MNPTQSSPTSGVLKVHYKPYISVLYIVAGSLLLASGLLLLFTGALSIWIFLGPLLLTAGILARFNPFLTFDAGQGSMYMHGPFGNRVRTYGAAKGERLYFDGNEIMRLRQDGSRKRISTKSGRPEEVEYLQQTLWSLQQGPTA